MQRCFSIRVRYWIWHHLSCCRQWSYFMPEEFCLWRSILHFNDSPDPYAKYSGGWNTRSNVPFVNNRFNLFDTHFNPIEKPLYSLCNYTHCQYTAFNSKLAWKTPNYGRSLCRHREKRSIKTFWLKKVSVIACITKMYVLYLKAVKFGQNWVKLVRKSHLSKQIVNLKSNMISNRFCETFKIQIKTHFIHVKPCSIIFQKF